MKFAPPEEIDIRCPNGHGGDTFVLRDLPSVTRRYLLDGLCCGRCGTQFIVKLRADEE